MEEQETIFYHAMDESDVEANHEASYDYDRLDGRLFSTRRTDTHIQELMVTFPKSIGYYVRDKKVLTLSEAIHK